MRDTGEQVQHVVDILAQRHPLFARATIERWVTNAFAAYGSAPVQTYVPILAQREIDARLRDLESDGPTPTMATPEQNHRARPAEPPRPAVGDDSLENAVGRVPQVVVGGLR